MEYQKTIQLAQANRDYKLMRSMQEEFNTALASYNIALNFTNQFSLSNNSLCIDCFGYTAIANPRIVKVLSGALKLEYRFIVEPEPSRQIELWRFYLGSNGLVTEREDDESAFANYDDRNLVSQLCTTLQSKTLESSFLKSTTTASLDV